MRWLRQLNTYRLVTSIAILGVFAMAARITMDTDTWWHLRAGGWIWEHKEILRTDPFSYTRFGEPWEYPGWLVEVPMYWIFRQFGPGGLNIWTALMVAIAFSFVWKTMHGGAFLRAFTLVLAASSSAVYWAARPYLVTFVFGAIYLWALEEDRGREYQGRTRNLWLLPLLMLIWANSHGGFIVGFILLGVYLLNAVRVGFEGLKVVIRLDRAGFVRLVFTIILCVLAVCINPYGPVMLLYPFKTVSITVLKDYIQEWQSPNFHALNVQPFIALLLTTFAAFGVSRRRVIFTDLALVSGFAYLGLMAGRNIALFAIPAPMVITRHIASITDAIGSRMKLSFASKGIVPRGRAFLNASILVLLVLVTLIKVTIVYPGVVNEEAFRKGLPIDAVHFVRSTRPSGRMLSSYNWGGYLLWALPEYPVFVDGRTDLYNDQIIGEWLKAVRAEDGWQQVLERWEIRLILLEPATPLVSKLNSYGWQLLYQDEISVVYGK